MEIDSYVIKKLKKLNQRIKTNDAVDDESDKKKRGQDTDLLDEYQPGAKD